ncbi:MAG: NAD-dependent DNA ligase LigA [Bacteriovoracales bacterium]|nr:NAD-dependent DNA ligase LigA [Bacteriovoracales bacterium]
MVNQKKELENKILEYKALYYQGRPTISDHEYDLLEEKLKSLDPTSHVLDIVGTKPTSSQKIKHDERMLSLDKTYLWDELEKWRGSNDVVSTYKIDGSSCSLLYKDGVLEVGKTRGDGQFGEDITEKVRWIQDIPKRLDVTNCEIRGELYCDEESFLGLSQEMADLGLERPKSPRNIVAGLLGRKENIELCRYLGFFAFEIMGHKDELDFETEWDKILCLKGLGLPIPQMELHRNGDGIEKIIGKAKSFMAQGPYLIDGIVFTHNDLALHKKLGNTAHHPRFKLAFKFKGESKKTSIREIIWSVSRNGNLIPVADVTPVHLSGAQISRVTLHNYGQVKLHNLKVDDEIEIIRSGEVIPKFLGVVRSSPRKFRVPKLCPSCKSKLKTRDIHLICPNPKCRERIRETILNYIQKIGIDDLSSKRLHAMFEKGLVKNIPDLYKLDKESLLTLDKTKEKLATKILLEIEKSKRVDLITFLSALGLSGGAYHKCEKVVRAGFDSLKKLKKMTEENLMEVESFAQKSSSEFIKSLSSKWKIIDELVDLGLKIKRAPSPKGILAQKKIVITGTLSKKRSEIERDIKRHGGTTSSSVSKAIDFLVSNDKDSTSTKTKKALELKIPILSEKELYEMMK